MVEDQFSKVESNASRKAERGRTMKSSRLGGLALAGMLTLGGQRLLAADLQYPFAESSLKGVVKSQKGEPLEGILVRAKREKAVMARAGARGAPGPRPGAQ